MNTAAILPAYEAEATVGDFLKELPRSYFQTIILVDDHSKDRTFDIASKDATIEVFRNERNLGYGGNLKRCFQLALERGADIIVEIHPDGEYGPESIGAAIDAVKAGAGLVLGNRFAAGKDPLARGMFVWKFPFIKLLNGIANALLGVRLGDLHQGFRVYAAPLLHTADVARNSDGYIFSFEIIAQAVYHGFRVAEVPQTCRYAGQKRGARLLASVLYSLSVFRVLLQFKLAQGGMPIRLFHKTHGI